MTESSIFWLSLDQCGNTCNLGKVPHTFLKPLFVTAKNYQFHDMHKIHVGKWLGTYFFKNSIISVKKKMVKYCEYNMPY